MTDKKEKKAKKEEFQNQGVQDKDTTLTQDNTSDDQEEIDVDVDVAIDFEVKLEEKQKECDEYLDMLKRSKAEFDNYRKRSIKEKDGIYDDGFVDGIKAILPVIDSLEKAVTYNTAENDSLLEGVQMVLKMFNDTLTRSEVEEIPAQDESFDPDVHNAVMHIEDENYKENVVVEVLQKGYKYKEKIIRYSMVKVAN